MRRPDDFRDTIRHGRSSSARTVIVHALFEGAPPPRIGLVVNKSVGIAVTRNQVKRRLRAILNAHHKSLPGGRLVVRAMPAAAGADFAVLSADVDRCVSRLLATAT